MNRVLIAGTHSGCGKTTVVCALLSALKTRGMDVSSFKCGPDYIDPMFHREVVGVQSHNLDPFFCDADMLRRLLVTHAHEVSVIEGVMGYYDGIGSEGRASTYDVARNTDTPVVLVVNARGMYNSAGALLAGFKDHRPASNLCGVIFNGMTPRAYGGFREIAENAGVKPFGFLPHHSELSVGSRHLGLITAAEVDDLGEKLDALGSLAEQNIDIDGILELAASAPLLDAKPSDSPRHRLVRIAVARDEAFCFLYQETIEVLESLGCEIVYFSPLHDRVLPEDIGGLYLCGGYPELHLEELSNNEPMRHSIRKRIEEGLPTIAECGGYLYLHDSVDGYPLAGLIHATGERADHLQHFGYATLTAQVDNLLCAKGDSLRAHEFHYYKTTERPDGFVAEKPGGGATWGCAHVTDTLYAGFPHLYLYANPDVAASFVGKAIRYESSDNR